MDTNHNPRTALRRLKDRIDIRPGLKLWAFELEHPVCWRRPQDYTRAARVLGWAFFVAQHRHAPCNIGCRCERRQEGQEALA